MTRSFLDYRIPVYEELNRLCGGKLNVIYFADVVPQRCQEKLRRILMERAIGLTGEIRLTGKKLQPVSSVKKNKSRIPYQPGLVRTIESTKPEAIISDGFFQWTYGALWLRLMRGIPHIMCYEGTIHTERGIRGIKQYYRKAVLKLIDHIACNGSLSTLYIRSLGYSERKISLGNMAADTKLLKKQINEFDVSQRKTLRAKLNLSDTVFLYAGRLVPLKGVDKLIDTWIKCFGIKREVSLLLVGDGPEREFLKQLIKKHNLSNVHLTGEIDFDYIYQYLAISDIFVIPTLQDNWSLVVPEAMSAGLPIICSKYNGCWPELVKPENGWVFDPLDQDNFVSTLKEAWVKRDNWEGMGKKSLEIVQDYTPEKVAQNIYSACLKVTASNSGKNE